MGVSVYAAAGIGIMIPKAKLRRQVKARQCRHPTTEAKFCPECGKPMWKEEWDWIEGYNADKDTLFSLPCFVQNFDGDSYSRPISDFALISTCLVKGSYDSIYPMQGSVLLGNIEEIKAVLKEILEPHGLWDETLFGLHLLLYPSC